MSFSTKFFTKSCLLSETVRFKYLQTSFTEGLPRWELFRFMESISPFNHASRVSGGCRRSSARTWLIYLALRPELPEEADADSTTCAASLMSFSTRFFTNVCLFSHFCFSDTAKFKYLHTSLSEGLPWWELPICMESISASNHASRASGRCRRSPARTLLTYLAIIEDPAEAAAAEEAMTSKENRIHTKNHTWISSKRCWVSYG